MKRALLIAMMSMFASEAAADVALVGPKGPAAKRVKLELTAMLSELDRVMSESKLTGGHRPPKSEAAYAGWLAAKAEERGVDRVVTAELKGRRLRLSVHRSGELVDEQRFLLGAKGKLASKVRQAIELFLERALRAELGSPEVEAGPEPEAEPEPEPEPAVLRSPSPSPPPLAENRVEVEVAPARRGRGFLFDTPEGAPAFLELAAGMTAVSRWFDYRDPFTGNLRPYQIYFMPAPSISAELYPLVPFASSLAGLGVTFDFARSIGAASAREGGPRLPTTYSTLSTALRYRFAITSGADPILLLPEVGYARTSLALGEGSDGGTEEELPDVAYSSLQLGSRFTLPLGAGFELLASAAFLKVFAAGEILSAAYHRGGANGISGSLSVRLRLPAHFAVDAGASYQRFFYSFDPEPGDRVIAGGALDQYLTARAALSLEL